MSTRYIPPLDIARAHARQVLAETADTDIHDHHAMVAAHASLCVVLEHLTAALDTEDAAPHHREQP